MSGVAISLPELVRFAARNATPAIPNAATRCLPDHVVTPARAFVWYLATPYTAPAADERQRRAELATRMTAQLLTGGLNVFSPIAAHHPTSEFMSGSDTPTHAQWMEVCYGMLDRCDGVIVSTMDGWWSSKGVQGEIARWKASKTMKRLVYAAPIRENVAWEPKFAWSPYPTGGF